MTPTQLAEEQKLLDAINERFREVILSAEHYLNSAREEPSKTLAVIDCQQAINTWKNCAFAEARLVQELQAERDAAQRLVRQCAMFAMPLTDSPKETVEATLDAIPTLVSDRFAELECAIARTEGDRDAAVTENGELKKEAERLNRLEAIILANHNGYNPKMREVMPTLKVPESTEQALRDLIQEENELHEFALHELAELVAQAESRANERGVRIAELQSAIAAKEGEVKRWQLIARLREHAMRMIHNQIDRIWMCGTSRTTDEELEVLRQNAEHENEIRFKNPFRPDLQQADPKGPS